MRALFTGVALLFCSVLAGAQTLDPKRLMVGGVELHYIEQGQGEPLIFLHGGQGDYRSWQPHMDALSPHYRVISYSRRYHYPNENPIRADHSALIDADDLAALINELDLGAAHLVGTSYGAFTALALALEQPSMVRSLVLAEPAILAWAANSPDGAAIYRDFMASTHEQAAPAFAAGNEAAAVQVFIDAFDGSGTFSSHTEQRRLAIMQNVGFFKAITLSSDPYPDLPKASVALIKAPVLVVRGEQTHDLGKFLSDELVRVLPHARYVVIPNAGHGSPRQNPQAFIASVLEFLDSGEVK